MHVSGEQSVGSLRIAVTLRYRSTIRRCHLSTRKRHIAWPDDKLVVDCPRFGGRFAVPRHKRIDGAFSAILTVDP